jgi:hypothetical protein
MSLDAGGLAQMTFNPTFNGGLGVPGSGFASRGKGSHIKRLSVPPPPKISTIDESQAADIAPTPRTSRSHLLAGLRTAPKSATLPPSTAPLSHGPQRFGLESSMYADPNAYSGRQPQTATTSSFPRINNSRQMYSLPEHVLAPPSIQIEQDTGDAEMDSKLYAELVATNLYLSQQQRQLQQQLLNVTAAAQQFQGMSLNSPMAMGVQQQFHYPMNSMGMYGAQLQQGMQPVVTEIPNQPGLYSVYNPITGQQSFVMDNTVQQSQSNDSPPPAYQELASSPPPPTPTFYSNISPPQAEKSDSYPGFVRGPSPPKSSPSPPQDVTPLPPPSANAFRRGHKKASSFASGIKTNEEVPKTAGPKSAGFPQTPLTGTFGPGQGRAGDHPIRQPRGPPALEELLAKPTSKFEGSKNFASRQRRAAVSNLVRAGIERRGNAGSGSGGNNTPASEGEFNFSVTSSENEDAGSATLSSKPSLGSLRAQASGAIGSERKERSRERGSVDSYTAASVSSDDGACVGGKLVEVKAEEAKPTERRKTPMLVLSSAEKRKSTIL